MKPSTSLLPAACALLALAAATATPALAQQKPGATAAPAPKGAVIERGRYLVKTTGCNDCHTPGYGLSGGKVEEKLWLTGDAMGWNGPWGTTYASNLRIYIEQHTEASWVKTAHSFTARPPMPYFSVNAMNDADLKAIYWFVKSLGPGGQPAPAYLPPGQKPNGPAIVFPG
jgi:mono/diheme cytochrome c family protein